MGQLAKGGTPAVVDRLLGLGYGGGAARALNNNQNGVVGVFKPTDLRVALMAKAINKKGIVSENSGFFRSDER